MPYITLSFIIFIGTLSIIALISIFNYKLVKKKFINLKKINVQQKED